VGLISEYGQRVRKQPQSGKRKRADAKRPAAIPQRAKVEKPLTAIG
jgi:hypothetical protein